MSQLTLGSPSQEPLDRLVASALELERREILTAIMKTKNKLSVFESKYGKITAQFMNEHGNIEEMEAIEWEGEQETLKRLQDKLIYVEEIRICT